MSESPDSSPAKRLKLPFSPLRMPGRMFCSSASLLLARRISCGRVLLLLAIGAAVALVELLEAEEDGLAGCGDGGALDVPGPGRRRLDRDVGGRRFARRQRDGVTSAQ